MSAMAENREDFNPQSLLNRLDRFCVVLPAVVKNFSSQDQLWRPSDDSWSVLEIVCHFADEEAEDFPKRVLLTLNDPNADWPGIDPEGWATARTYQSQDIEEQLNRFVSLRVENLKHIRALVNPNWSSTKAHPKLGEMVASDLLAAWCAHDALHLRQLAKRLHQLAIRDAGSKSTTEYAGIW